MASRSTARRWPGVAGGALATVAVAVTAALVTAGPAAAENPRIHHTPKVTADCTDGTTALKVKLTKYVPSGENTVKVTQNGAVLDDTEFDRDYERTWEFPGDVDYTFVVDVKAWDDPNSSKGYSFVKTIKVPACVTPTSTTTPPPTSTTTTEPPTMTSAPTTTTESSTTETSPPPTSVAPAPPGEGGLPDTGASILIPLVIGALMLAGGAGLLVLMRRRRSA